MRSRYFHCLLALVLATALTGCRARNETNMDENSPPERSQNVQVTEGATKDVTHDQAVRIAENEVRKRVHLDTGKTLRSEATHYGPGQAASEQYGKHKDGGWSVTVWLVPAETGGIGLSLCRTMERCWNS